MQFRTALFVALVFVLSTATLYAQQGQRRILLEEFSTAQCGFCPDGTVVAKKLVHDHPSVIWVTHHAGFGTDSMTVPASKDIASAFTNFAPGACIDRGVFPIHVSPYIEQYGKIATIRAKWDSVVTAHLADEQFADIRIRSQYDAQTTILSVTVDVVFGTVPAPGDIRLNLFLVEDSVKGLGTGYDQKNYYNGDRNHPMYQKGDPVVGYAHLRVVSGAPTGSWGAAGIVPSQPQAGITYTYTWAGPLTEVWDPCNFNRPEVVSLVAFLSYHDSDVKKRQVIHANEARIENITSTAPLPERSGAITARVYPNPVRGAAHIALDRAFDSDAVLLVVDPAGREQFRHTLARGSRLAPLPLGNLPAGMYLYRIISSSQTPVVGSFMLTR